MSVMDAIQPADQNREGVANALGAEDVEFIELSQKHFAENTLGFQTFPPSLEGKKRPSKFMHMIFSDPTSIHSLTNRGIGPRTVEKLANAGFTSVFDLMHIGMDQLHAIVNDKRLEDRIADSIRSRLERLGKLPHEGFLRRGILPYALRELSPAEEELLIISTNQLLDAAGLSDRQRSIINSMYNLNFQSKYWSGHSYEDVAREYHITRERVRQILNFVFAKLSLTARAGYRDALFVFVKE